MAKRTKSALKANRQNIKRREHNRQMRSKLRSALKAIRVSLDAKARLRVENDGPPLPEALRDSLFDSMISQRDERSSVPHLGLGLYIARLIAEFHGGTLLAENLSGARGVAFEAALASV